MEANGGWHYLVNDPLFLPYRKCTKNRRLLSGVCKPRLQTIGRRGIEGGIAQSTDAHLHTHYSSGEIGGHFDRIGGGGSLTPLSL